MLLDEEKPIFSGPLSDIKIYITSSSDAPVAVSWTAPTATDAYGVTVTSTHNPPDTFPIGNTNVKYTATDEAGNIAEVAFTVIIILGMYLVILRTNEYHYSNVILSHLLNVRTCS